MQGFESLTQASQRGRKMLPRQPIRQPSRSPRRQDSNSSSHESSNAVRQSDSAVQQSQPQANTTPQPSRDNLEDIRGFEKLSLIGEDDSQEDTHTNSQADPSSDSKKEIAGVQHTKLPIQSSEFRFFRRIQCAENKKRNIAQIKLIPKKESEQPPERPLYLIARSMGANNSKLLLSPEDKNQDGSTRRRGHSEAVLAAALSAGNVNVGENRYKLRDDYEINYAASSNEACKQVKGSENCAENMVPRITGSSKRFVYANPYSGSKQAKGFKRLLNEHQENIEQVKGYTSETESESEADVVVIKDEMLRGKEIEKMTGVEGEEFNTYLKNLPKYNSPKRNKRYREEDLIKYELRRLGSLLTAIEPDS